MKTLVLITTALTFGVLGCSNPYERDNPTDPIFVYTVTFNASDATSGTPPAAVSGSWGDVVTLPDGGSLQRSNYLLVGWNTNSSSTGTEYKTGSSYTVEKNITLYAKWVSCNSEICNSGTHFWDMRDEQVYRITTIGTQTWMAENLNYNASGSKCYDNLDSECDQYGRLYNWATAMGFNASCNENSCSSQIQSKHKGVCPEGWHIPNQADWNALTSYAGAASKLKAVSGWIGSKGTDDYGFSALQAGYGNSDGSFSTYRYGYWWCASEYSRNLGDYLYIIINSSLSFTSKSDLYSVRCLKD
jgi:uncharacterized protein (TIGR02145 family)